MRAGGAIIPRAAGLPCPPAGEREPGTGRRITLTTTERTAPESGRGHLVLIGGAEDKRGAMTVLRHALGLNQGRSVVVIPTASDEPRQRADEYRRAFSALGASQVAVADVRNRTEAVNARVVAMVEAADLVFFTGGDQVRLVATLAGTPLEAAVRAALDNGATVAGTSAGAAAAGEITIYHGDGAGLVKGAVHHTPGFGFLPGLVVDTHFDMRERLPRLVQFLCSGGGLRGIGLAEDTAVSVTAEGLATVVGAAAVTVLDASDVEASNFDDLGERGILTATGLGLGFLAPGTVFDLDCWRVAGLPERLDMAFPTRRDDLHEGLRAE